MLNSTQTESCEKNRPATGTQRSAKPLPERVRERMQAERELLIEGVRGIQTIRDGSIFITVHEGRVVEIIKTIRTQSSTLAGQK